MRGIFLFLIGITSFVGCAQVAKDTLFLLNNKVIPCTITHKNSEHLYFKRPNHDIESLPKNQLICFSENGVRTDIRPNSLDNKASNSKLEGQEFAYMRQCFLNFHRQYITGVSLTYGGLFLTLGGAALTINSEEPQTGQLLTFTGALITLAGTIVTIDSHKWIKRAGLSIHGTANGVALNYRIQSVTSKKPLLVLN